MVVTETNGDTSNLTIKENSPTNGLLRFLAARERINQGGGCRTLFSVSPVGLIKIINNYRNLFIGNRRLKDILHP